MTQSEIKDELIEMGFSHADTFVQTYYFHLVIAGVLYGFQVNPDRISFSIRDIGEVAHDYIFSQLYIQHLTSIKETVSNFALGKQMLSSPELINSKPAA